MYELPSWVVLKLIELSKNLHLDYCTLSENYRNGIYHKLSSTQAMTYAIGRMPATYSVIKYILEKFKSNYAMFSKVLDIGSGCGSLPIALDNQNIDYTGIDYSKEMISVAQELTGSYLHFYNEDIQFFSFKGRYEAVFASYSLNEIQNLEVVLHKIYSVSSHYVFIIEPGTPKGYKNILLAKKIAKEYGFQAILPCASDCCFLKEGDWCHFSIRVPRTKIHTQLKGGILPYEDEKFSYVVFSKNADDVPVNNIVIKNPMKRKGHSIFDVCTKNGLERRIISHKNLKQKIEWGDELKEIE